ncbi:hypothetical protein MXEN_16422 [Mycobacterium xenopi RIVM700367]|nr:hypothetical protein MXEN_16422 [Mycobacterium xenopi RIVM700367]
MHGALGEQMQNRRTDITRAHAAAAATGPAPLAAGAWAEAEVETEVGAGPETQASAGPEAKIRFRPRSARAVLRPGLMRRGRWVAGVFLRAGGLLGRRLLADSLLAGGFLGAWAVVFVGRSVVVAGAMPGSGGQPGFAAGAKMAATEIGLLVVVGLQFEFLVVGLEFGFLVVIRFGFVIVPLDRKIALVHVEVFGMRCLNSRRCVVARRLVFADSF